MDLLQTLLVYMSLVFAASVQTAPEPSIIPDALNQLPGYVQATAEPTPAPTPVPTIAITPNPAYKTLQMGDRGDLVRDMQEALRDYGYYQGDIDGAYGNQTRQAVEQFQYMHGLTADGIAGRRTLTVLYESNEIRLPPQATPTPTAAATLAPAITATPALNFTPIPILTATPRPTAKPAATEPPADVEKMEGYMLELDGMAVELNAYRRGQTIYLPMVELMKAAGINVISSSTTEMDEYAFASGFTFVRFTYTKTLNGQPEELQLYRNDAPQLVPDRSLCEVNGVLYVPLQSVENITGMTCAVDDEQHKIIISSAEESI